ncbi:MAG: glycosyltransferase family 4 protein [Chloroflexi bacterium]|nr:glycosyltransferase family 4 protein [Chloroflexota bacterium]
MTFSVILITELYYPEDTSTGYYLTKIAEEITKRVPVQVICAQPTYSKRGIHAPGFEIHNGVEIHRCKSSTFDKNSLIKRILNQLTLTLSIFIVSIKRIRSNNIVFVVTTPPLLPLIVALVCYIRRAKYILIIHDVYPDVLSTVGLLDKKSTTYQIFSWLNCLIYKNAEKIITLGRDMYKLISQKVNSPSRIEIIPNWGDVHEVIPEDRGTNKLLTELGLLDKFIFQFMGNIGRTHNIEILLELANKFESDYEFHFLFIGWGAKRPIIENYIHKNSPSNVTLLPIQKREDLSTALNACDVAILSYIEGMEGISVPSRMYNVMAAGKPILAITNPYSEVASVIKEESIGWIVPPNSLDQLYTTILKISQNREIIKEMGIRARNAVVKRYSQKMAVEAYLKLVEQYRGVY